MRNNLVAAWVCCSNCFCLRSFHSQSRELKKKTVRQQTINSCLQVLLVPKYVQNFETASFFPTSLEKMGHLFAFLEQKHAITLEEERGSLVETPIFRFRKRMSETL